MNRSLTVVSHESSLAHETGPHPECAQRLEVIEDAIRADSELRARLSRCDAPEASDEAILRCHERSYLERVLACEGRTGRLDPDTVHSPETVTAVRHAAGAAGAAVDVALASSADAPERAFALVRPPGHHATPNRAMGFCFFNNAAIAARHAQACGMERVLIVDYDVHHGNGTQDIFYEDGSVFFYSLHMHPHYPGTGAENERGRGEGEGTTLNRPLPGRFPADEYEALFDSDLDSIFASFRPDFTILSAGFDSHRLDPLGGLSLENENFHRLTRMLVDRAAPGRLVATLEGGYNLDVLGSAVVAALRALAGLGYSAGA